MDTTLDTCGCCVGIEQLTPAVIANRSGLSELAYRTGIHATFLETMLARLSTMSLSADELDALLFDATVKEALIYPLSGLTTRSTDDPAIALLDAWAIVADVLTFYQERIANEGYLRTATERRSILELANLVGYTLRPGVASSVYLSFTLNDSQVSTTIPAGTRAQSLPGPGQMPQPFETSVDIEARAAWNAMKPKLSVAQYITQLELPNPLKVKPPPVSIDSIYASTADGALYLKGTSTNLKAHDPVLFVFTIKPGEQVFNHVLAVDPHQAEQFTRVTFPPEFTPLTFYKKLRDVLTLYQNADLFAISGGDTLVKNIVGELQNLFQQVLQAEPSSTDTFIDSDLSGNFLHDLNGLCYLYQKSVNASPPLDNNSFPTVSGLENLLGIAPGTYSNYGNDLSQLVNIVDNLFTTASTPRTRLAAWMGGVINDIKGIVLPVDKEFVTVCTPLVTTSLASLFGPLAKPPSLPPVNSTRLNRDINQIFARKGDIAPQLISTLNSAVGQNIYQALASANVAGDPDPSVAHPSLDTFYALRVKAAPFGNSVPKQPVTSKESIESAEIAELPTGEIPHSVQEESETPAQSTAEWQKTPGVKDITTITYFEWPLATADQSTNVLYLDARYDQIVPGSWVVIKYVTPLTDDKSAGDGVNNPLGGLTMKPLQAIMVNKVDTLARTDYGLSIKVTKLTLDGQWFTTSATNPLLTAFRGVTVYAQSEKLDIADEPIIDDISGDHIELGDLFDGLQSGRWAVVSGERSDIPNTSGIKTSELVMLASVEQSVRAVEVPPKPSQGGGGGGSTPPPTPTTDETPISNPSTPTDTTVHIPLPGDKTHTTLHFAQSLQYTYKRDTVAVAANVAHATHGETRVEVLGSGDGSKATQKFQLRQFPLTYISSPSISGADSTLEVRVNDLLWHETDTLANKGPKDRVYITKTDDQDKTTVVFGGARLSTGVENIKAKYRTGIGKSGNVDDGQISQLASRPLGVKGVINPKAATGGADRESRDQGRRNAPLGVIALDRLVSVQDYADFARTYAGIGKASAAWLSDGRRQLVHLTVAGSDNIPIDPTSDLFRNLFLSLRLYGNPSEPLQLALCEVKLLVISARVLVLPDYKLELVAPNIRTALNDAFSFEQRDLGQPVYQSEVLSIIQDVPGVSYVDLDIMDAVDQAKLLAALDQIHLEELHEAATGQKPNITEDLVKLMKLKSQPFVAAELARRNSKNKGGDGAILPAQLVFLSPDVPDTLIIRDLATSSAVQSKRKR